MDTRTLPQRPTDGQRPPNATEQILVELRQIRREQTTLRRLIDEGIGAFLNGKFPYGKPVDRWARR